MSYLAHVAADPFKLVIVGIVVVAVAGHFGARIYLVRRRRRQLREWLAVTRERERRARLDLPAHEHAVGVGTIAGSLPPARDLSPGWQQALRVLR